MPEIVVRAKHNDLFQQAVLHFLRFTFPVWGVLSPTIFIGALFAWVAAGIGWTSSLKVQMAPSAGYLLSLLIAASPQIIPFVGYTLCLLIVPIACLTIMRMLSKNNLLLEKNGIVLPIESFHWRFRRFVPWSKIRKITARKVPSRVLFSDLPLTELDRIWGKPNEALRIEQSPADNGADWRQHNLVLYVENSKPIELDLSKYESSEVEQILVAMETWGTDVEVEVSDLHRLLRDRQSTVEGLSYTDMWEDELRRRYNPTAFIPLDPGIVLHGGKLKVIRQLATGGLSAIYLTQLADQKLAVLKEAVLPEDASEGIRAKASELFAREAQLLSRLNHANIVKVLDYFVEGGRNYMLMEYVPGQDLRQFIKQNGAQRETIVVDWGVQIINIIKYLHELDPPVIHRDLTPDNLVLREDGNIVLIDFGAANEFISKGTGTFVGKQSFIAPEQFRGKAVLQSDIYAFGCTMFFLLTGQEPEALDCSSPRRLDDKISQELDEAIQCCTQLEVQDRYQSAAQLLPVFRKIAASLLGVV